MAQDGAGVAITYASAQPKADEVVRGIESAGGRALAIRADSADANAVKNAVAETVRTLARLDVLVNNAGIMVVSPLDQFALDDFDRMVADTHDKLVLGFSADTRADRFNIDN